MLASVDSSKLIMNKSQIEREASRKRIDKLQKISVDQRERLFQSIQKGKNKCGGVFGGTSPLREPSPSTFISGLTKATSKLSKEDRDPQRYQHSQKDPIIVRGNQNVHVNHLVIRNKALK